VGWSLYKVNMRTTVRRKYSDAVGVIGDLVICIKILKKYVIF